MMAAMEIVLVGAHMTGLPLNHEITELGGQFLRPAETEGCYRLYVLPGGPPARPGLLRVATGGGGIAVEVWAVPAESVGALLATIPAPLGLGTIRLADGTTPKGFLVEAEGVAGAADISHYGGWRAYLAAADAGPGQPQILDAAIEAACALHGVTPRLEWHDTILMNFTTIATAARFVGAFPLEDEAEYAPRFEA